MERQNVYVGPPGLARLSLEIGRVCLVLARALHRSRAQRDWCAMLSTDAYHCSAVQSRQDREAVEFTGRDSVPNDTSKGDLLSLGTVRHVTTASFSLGTQPAEPCT
jgi:hypothetical protein